jgi:putative copper export protein
MAARRFRRLVPYMLGLMLVADGAIVLGQGAELAGGWSGAFAPSLLQAILFGSRFGLFWWMRQGIVLAGLGLTLLANWRGWSMWQVGSQASTRVPAIDTEPRAIPDWWRAVLKTLRGIPRLPAQLLAGWRRRSWLGRVELLLGAALLVAFALSGHAAAVPTPKLGYSLSVDLLHLLGNAVWAGGLLYIGFVIVPVLRRLSIRQHARVLALGLPAFSVLATVSVVVLAATGSLNATIRLTSWQQFLTTPYGWILAVKIEFFLLMVLLSVYHAFYLRPRLAQALTSSEEVVVGTPGQALVGVGHASAARTAQATNNAPGTDDMAGERDEEEVSERAQHLAERLEGWLRREAMLGVAVLFCVALLGAFAGTLAPPL